ncbi:hypothetical protein CVT25_011651 [Psilocybe cyanescens]|uniref:Uncharacterized protein n=1 Tax=Psilocybe cyanescens TaxID=93625 RepID=A0A409WIL4_PSICY|nr:hypothetical protein CVT25_011651 [Psilocybe cyanescens]
MSTAPLSPDTQNYSLQCYELDLDIATVTLVWGCTRNKANISDHIQPQLPSRNPSGLGLDSPLPSATALRSALFPHLRFDFRSTSGVTNQRWRTKRTRHLSLQQGSEALCLNYWQLVFRQNFLGSGERLGRALDYVALAFAIPSSILIPMNNVHPKDLASGSRIMNKKHPPTAAHAPLIDKRGTLQQLNITTPKSVMNERPHQTMASLIDLSPPSFPFLPSSQPPSFSFSFFHLPRLRPLPPTFIPAQRPSSSTLSHFHKGNRQILLLSPSFSSLLVSSSPSTAFARSCGKLTQTPPRSNKEQCLNPLDELFELEPTFRFPHPAHFPLHHTPYPHKSSHSTPQE